MAVKLQTDGVTLLYADGVKNVTQFKQCILNDGNWYTASLSISNSAARVEFSGLFSDFLCVVNIGLTRQLGSYVFLGNFAAFQSDFLPLTNALDSKRGFDGCVKDLSVDGLKKSLSTFGENFTDHDPDLATSRCESDSFCDVNPCANEGTCIGSFDGAKCKCQSGYKGSTCQESKKGSFSRAFFSLHGFSPPSCFCLFFGKLQLCSDDVEASIDQIGSIRFVFISHSI